MNKVLFTDYEFNYLGFDISIYPSTSFELTISIFDPLHGVKVFRCPSVEITEDVMQFAMGKVREQIANDEEMQ